MHHDPARARRHALSLLAGAAALVWLLALSGLGGWHGGTEPAAAPPWQPPAPEPAAAPLRPLAAYAVIGERPLFTPDRRPQPFALDADDATGAHAVDHVLTGVVITPVLEVAILTPLDGGEPVRVQRGEFFPGKHGWQLHTLAPREALFQTPDGLVRFDLRGTDDPAAPSTSLRSQNTP